MMSAFNKKKVFDCLRDACVVEDQSCRDADEVVACDGFELRLNRLTRTIVWNVGEYCSNTSSLSCCLVWRVNSECVFAMNQ